MTDLLTRGSLRWPRSHYLETKDPCPVFDGQRWHLFGTGVTAHRFELLHATARRLSGPWRMHPPVAVETIDGGCVAAPGVIAEPDALHMFLQTDYNRYGGRIEHLVSLDGGQTFDHARTALTSIVGTAEAGIYDPHPARIGAECFLVYSAFSVVGEPDVHLARSTSGTWDGPWERLGPILRHEDVACHNQRGDDGYEWGLEGAQLLELPDGRVLMNAVCFLPAGTPGTRQRVFLAIADDPLGPYDVLGPALTPPGGAGAGENGHGAVVLVDDELVLAFQERDGDGARWRYALASAPIAAVLAETTGEEQAA